MSLVEILCMLGRFYSFILSLPGLNIKYVQRTCARLLLAYTWGCNRSGIAYPQPPRVGVVGAGGVGGVGGGGL